MNQDKVWEYFQNECHEVFLGNAGRLEFIARRLTCGQRVLNIGVGNGALEMMAHSKGVEIYALDPSETAILALQRQFSIPSDRMKVGYSQAIPFSDGFFDIVIMSEVLEHLEDSILEESLIEVNRVLNKRGLFMGTVPANEILVDSLVVCPHCGERFHRWGHLRSFNMNSLFVTLNSFFNATEVSEHFFIAWDSVDWVNRFTGLLRAFLSWCGIGTYGANRNLFFCAQKRHHEIQND